jgi:hypothetical protein
MKFVIHVAHGPLGLHRLCEDVAPSGRMRFIVESSLSILSEDRLKRLQGCKQRHHPVGQSGAVDFLPTGKVPADDERNSAYGSVHAPLL